MQSQVEGRCRGGAGTGQGQVEPGLDDGFHGELDPSDLLENLEDHKRHEEDHWYYTTISTMVKTFIQKSLMGKFIMPSYDSDKGISLLSIVLGVCCSAGRKVRRCVSIILS